MLGSSVYGILQARILEWAVVFFSRGSSQPRDPTQVSHIAGRSLLSELPEVKPNWQTLKKKNLEYTLEDSRSVSKACMKVVRDSQQFIHSQTTQGDGHINLPECVLSHFSHVQVLCNPVDCSLSASSVHAILQAEILNWVARPSSRDLLDLGIKPMSPVAPALQVDFFSTEPPGKPYKLAPEVNWHLIQEPQARTGYDYSVLYTHTYGAPRMSQRKYVALERCTTVIVYQIEQSLRMHAGYHMLESSTLS